jgi:hypothetical protein
MTRLSLIIIGCLLSAAASAASPDPDLATILRRQALQFVNQQCDSVPEDYGSRAICTATRDRFIAAFPKAMQGSQSDQLYLAFALSEEPPTGISWSAMGVNNDGQWSCAWLLVAYDNANPDAASPQSLEDQRTQCLGDNIAVGRQFAIQSEIAAIINSPRGF